MVAARSLLNRVKGKLEIHTVRRAPSLLDGRYRSVFKGTGMDFDDLRQYQPGDDVSDIDWKSSSKSDVPIIKQFVENRQRNILFVVDTGRNMATTAPSQESKRDVTVLSVGFLAYIAHLHGDNVGLVAGDAQRIKQVPLRHFTNHVELILQTIDHEIVEDGPRSDLDRLLGRVLRTVTRRCMVIVVTDEARPGPEHERALRLLRSRHEILVVTIGDANPVQREFAGRGVRDIDAPLNLPDFVRSRMRSGTALTEAVEARRDAVSGMLQRLSINSARVDSEDLVVPALTELLRVQKHARR